MKWHMGYANHVEEEEKPRKVRGKKKETHMRVILIAAFLATISPAFGQDVNNNPKPAAPAAVEKNDPDAAPAAVVETEPAPAAAPAAVKIETPAPAAVEKPAPVPAAPAAVKIETSAPDTTAPAAVVKPAPVPAAPMEKNSSAPPRGGISGGAIIAVVGAGVAAAGATGWFTWRAGALDKALDRQRGPDRRAFEDARSELALAEHISAGAMISGGAIVAAGVILWWMDDTPPDKPGITLAPTHGGGGFAVYGSF